MASGGVTSNDAASSTPAQSPGPPAPEKPGPSRTWGFGRNPPMLRMVLEALAAREQRRGMSVVAIKLYILNKYPTAADARRFKYLLKQALDTGMRRGLLTRPVNSRARGATGSFKLAPKHKTKVQARTTPAAKAPRRAREALGKGSKKPGQEEKEAARAGRVQKAAPRPGAANPKVPKRGRPQAKGTEAGRWEAKGAEASKPPPKPAKATRAPSGANGTSEKAKVHGKRRKGDAEAGGKSKAKNASSEAKNASSKAKNASSKVKNASSKPADKQVKNGVTSPTKRKMAAKTPIEKAGQEAGQGSRTKVAAIRRKGDGSKAVPAALARKTEAPEGLRKSRLSTRSSSSNARSKKVEAES